MTTNAYQFITQWQAPGTCDEVASLLGNALDLPRWWPSVYLKVWELEKGDPATGLGRIIRLYTKGWLPYTLVWQFQVTEVNHPHGFRLDAWGDFVGRGIWEFTQMGDQVRITYDWKITAQKRLLRDLSFIFKPLFSANHEWAMRMGEQSLKLELARRHAITYEQLARIPAPPGPTFAAFIAKEPKVMIASLR